MDWMNENQNQYAYTYRTDYCQMDDVTDDFISQNLSEFIIH